MAKTQEQIMRAYRMLDFIEAHPDKHDQASWINRWDEHGDDMFGDYRIAADKSAVMNTCGTTCCAAGWTVLLEGQEITDSAHVAGFGDLVEYVAADLLGLDDAERHGLFLDAADLADVRKAVGEIFGPRPFVPGYDAVTP